MIEELYVRGIGGINEAQLSFNGNFIVITGESGSGKSSLVRALEFITGTRAQVNIIHTLEDSCTVTMTISIQNDKTNSILLDAFQSDDDLLIIERNYNKLGKGKVTVQGITSPVNVLSSLMENRIVIQSQFSQLDLINPSKQLSIVDSFGCPSLKKTANELADLFEKTLSVEKEIISVKKKRKEIEDNYQGFEKTLNEIKSLKLQEDSEESWQKELNKLEELYKQKTNYKEITQKLIGTPSNEGILDELDALSKQIYKLSPNDLSWHKIIEKMLSSIQDFSTKLTENSLSNREYAEMEEKQILLEQKIGTLRKIKRELNILDSKALVNYVKKATLEIEWLKNSNITLESLNHKSFELKREVSTKVLKLRELRKKSAKKLSSIVNKNLSEMAMEHAIFTIEVEGLDRVRSSGADSVSFNLALHNQGFLPVAKNASGGELSRILISLQLALSDSFLPDTLVFDEVEAGLGGKTALLAGYKLRELSKKCRTILVTHEATIAAMADQHFLVKRAGLDTEIIEVSGTKREQEIARMLAGNEKSEEALRHAKALLQKKQML